MKDPSAEDGWTARSPVTTRWDFQWHNFDKWHATVDGDYALYVRGKVVPQAEASDCKPAFKLGLDAGDGRAIANAIRCQPPNVSSCESSSQTG